MSRQSGSAREMREQRVFWLLMILVGGILLVGFVAPRYWRLCSLRSEVERLEGRRRRVEEENERVKMTLDALDAGRPEVWRLYVRDRLHYVEKGFVPVLCQGK